MNVRERDAAVVEMLAAVSQLKASVDRIAHPVSTLRLVADHADVLDATARVQAAVVAYFESLE